MSVLTDRGCAQWQLALKAHDTARHGTAQLATHSGHQQGTTGFWFFIDVCVSLTCWCCAFVLGFIVPAACVSAGLIIPLFNNFFFSVVSAAAGPGLSTYMPLRKEPPLISDANLKTPIFQAHGDMDYTVRRGMGPLADCLHGLCCVQQV